MSAVRPSAHFSSGALPLGLYRRLVRENLATFLSELRDVDGTAFGVPAHQEVWCRLVVANPRLCLLAPRDHGKSTIAIAFILWQFLRHETASTKAVAVREHRSASGSHDNTLGETINGLYKTELIRARGRRPRISTGWSAGNDRQLGRDQFQHETLLALHTQGSAVPTVASRSVRQSRAVLPRRRRTASIASIRLASADYTRSTAHWVLPRGARLVARGVRPSSATWSRVGVVLVRQLGDVRGRSTSP